MSNTISQSFIPTLLNTIPCRRYSRRHAGEAARRILQAAEKSILYIGLDSTRSRNGRIESLALATPHEIFIISIGGKEFSPNDKPFEELIGGKSVVLVGFQMTHQIIQISYDLELSIKAINLSIEADTRNPLRPSQIFAKRVSSNFDKFALDALWNGNTEQNGTDMCLRAWISACVADNSRTLLENAVKLDTCSISSQEMPCLATIVRHLYLLEDSKPKEAIGEFSDYQLRQDGTIALQNSRYKARIRRSQQTTIIMTNENGIEFTGEANYSAGKQTDIRIKKNTFSGTLQKVRVVGRQELTNPERARDEFLLSILQKKNFLRDSLFIRKLWFPSKRDRAQNRKTYPIRQFPGLNASQAKAASLMTSESPLVIVHGPPGTGKTRTIATVAAEWDKKKKPCWITAHSNVAVKNIAETLHKQNVDFKLLVSKEFYQEWHEHLYMSIPDRLIRSDDLAGTKDVVATERLIGGSSIILSTLSMLSNPALEQVRIFQVVPTERLIVDEASQIKIEDFMHIFGNFRKTLQKVCFFGDPKQLPPYGQDKISDIKTIFDVEHLNSLAEFLDTQYRMPVPLGKFISRRVYGGKLESIHKIRGASCVSFVDASKGMEKKRGSSWVNEDEIQILVHLIRHYYRYQNFCIITPYDAQRAAIEARLKHERLPWECVFNVDSFQGNEADFVLISVVRSGNQAGFLTSINRMNVMLTRCRKGLIVVTSRSFIRSGGSSTLLGSLERDWAVTRGESTWVDWKAVAEGTVDLPGAPGPNRREEYTPNYINRKLPYAVDTPWGPQKKFDVKALFQPSRSNTGSETATRINTYAAAFWRPLPISQPRPSQVLYIQDWATVRTPKYHTYAWQDVPWSSASLSPSQQTAKDRNSQYQGFDDLEFPSLPIVDVPHVKPNLPWRSSTFSIAHKTRAGGLGKMGKEKVPPNKISLEPLALL